MRGYWAYVIPLVVGCGGDDGIATGDASVATIDASADASVSETLVTGTLYDVPFTLRYASRKLSTPLEWICVADIPLTYAECEQNGGPERVMLLGPYIYDDGMPKWGIPQVWLYHVGTSYSKPVDSGTLQIYVDNQTTGELQLTLDLDLGETKRTAGSVLVAPP